MDPASIAFAALAEEFRRAGRFDEAVATCEAGLLRHPAYLSARVTLGRALLEMGRFEEARDELEHVLRVAPENLAAIRGLAEIHQRHGLRSEEGDGADSPAADTPPETAEHSSPEPAAATVPAPEREPIRLIPLSSLAPEESVLEDRDWSTITRGRAGEGQSTSRVAGPRRVRT